MACVFYKVNGIDGHKSSFNTSNYIMFECHKNIDIVIYFCCGYVFHGKYLLIPFERKNMRKYKVQHIFKWS